MQKCQPRGSVTWTLISVMALSGVVCSSLPGRRGKVGKGKVGEIIRKGGGSGRKGEEGSHAGLPNPIL